MNEHQFESYLTELFQKTTPPDVRPTALILRGLEKRSHRREWLLIAAAALGVAISLATLFALQILPVLGMIFENTISAVVKFSADLTAVGVSSPWPLACVGLVFITVGGLRVWRES